jgi:hypothetical protein
MYVYKTTNLINGKIYVGASTKDIELSKNYLGSGNVMIKALQKYGSRNFKKDILISGIQSLKVLADAETSFINKYKSSVEFGNYNIMSHS